MKSVHLLQIQWQRNENNNIIYLDISYFAFIIDILCLYVYMYIYIMCVVVGSGGISVDGRNLLGYPWYKYAPYTYIDCSMFIFM